MRTKVTYPVANPPQHPDRTDPHRGEHRANDERPDAREDEQEHRVGERKRNVLTVPPYDIHPWSGLALVERGRLRRLFALDAEVRLSRPPPRCRRRRPPEAPR